MKRTDYKALRQVIYHEIEKDTKKKNLGATQTVPYDKNLYDKGMEWYNSGLTLEDASPEDRNNIHFVNGYERGKRLALIEEMQKNKAVRR